MAKRGRMVYVPAIVIDEIEDIKQEEEIVVGSEAFRKLVKHARIGREVDRLSRLDFRSKPIIDSFRKKKKRGIF